jgi:2-polyprenyl-3-methyl-5-hydroxy-6-metoxy-1,4-benzoquinol methylase
MNKSHDYEKWWRDYDEINRLDPGTRIRKELIIDGIKAPKYKKILDLGCGSGELLATIKKLYSEKELYGADVSKEALELLSRRRIVIKSFLLDLDLEKPLPTGDGYGHYDAIVCSEVIEHLKNWQNVFKLLKNLTKEKSRARVIITTQSGKKYPHHVSIGHIQHFEPKEIVSKLEENSFNVIYANKLGWPFMNIKNLMVTHLLGGNTLESGKISLIQKIGLRVFYYLYKISLKGFGPQIVVIAERK